MEMPKQTREDVMQHLKYLRMLSNQYPNIQAASTEIINLQAILGLPKGTEHFMSDLHGEYEAFIHIRNSASGAIREKVDAAVKRLEKKMKSSGLLPQRMFLLTNSTHCYGAACILYPGVLYALARREKEDLYILPVSIDDVLVIPAGDKIDGGFLKQRMMETAGVEQREKDWLSGKLYRYIAERDVIVEV